MNNLQSSIAQAIAKDIEINKEDLVKVTTACTTIAVEHMKGLVNYMAQNVEGFYFINNEGRWELRDGVGLTSTTELVETYISTLK